MDQVTLLKSQLAEKDASIAQIFEIMGQKDAEVLKLRLQINDLKHKCNTLQFDLGLGLDTGTDAFADEIAHLNALANLKDVAVAGGVATNAQKDVHILELRKQVDSLKSKFDNLTEKSRECQ